MKKADLDVVEVVEVVDSVGVADKEKQFQPILGRLGSFLEKKKKKSARENAPQLRFFLQFW